MDTINQTSTNLESLPSIDEIKAATHVLSTEEASAKVVRLRSRFAVKFSNRVSLVEAETMRFLAANSDVPLPKVHAVYSESDPPVNYIVMDYVDGRTLESLWPSLSDSERHDIALLVKDALGKLRGISPLGYLGSVNRQYCEDGVFWKMTRDELTCGPFGSEEKFNEGILRRLSQYESAPSLRIFRDLVTQILRGHKTVFTHGDIQPKNIMVKRVGDKEDGSGVFEIYLIDWEISGWYPDYWEFCNASISGRFKPDWFEMIQKILPLPSTEWLLMNQIRNVLFY